MWFRNIDQVTLGSVSNYELLSQVQSLLSLGDLTFFFFQVSYFRDTYAEHPEDRENIEYRVHLKDEESLVTLSGTSGTYYAKQPKYYPKQLADQTSGVILSLPIYNKIKSIDLGCRSYNC